MVSKLRTNVAIVNSVPTIARIRQKATGARRWLFSRDTQFFELVAGAILVVSAFVLASGQWRLWGVPALRASLNSLMPEMGWAGASLCLGLLKMSAVLANRIDIRRFMSLVASGWWMFLMIVFARSGVVMLETYFFVVFFFGSAVSYRSLCLIGIGGRSGNQ